MAQGVLRFQYEREKTGSGMTGLAGLPVYLDLIQVMGLSKSINEHVGVRDKTQGWTDAEVVLSLLLLNLAGGESVEDLKGLEEDEGFCRVLEGSQNLRDRSRMKRRWRCERKRHVPSASAVFRYLAAFHDSEQEKMRQSGHAFIPVSNGPMRGLERVNREMVGFMQSRRIQTIATLDMDATVVETNKSSALFSYKGNRAYQPLNTWWAEQGMVLHTEFRDGNVPAGHEQLRVLKESLLNLPSDVKKVRLRSDTAGYQHDLLAYCENGEDVRFGRIEFAISCDVSVAFRKAVAETAELEWKPYYRECDGRRIKTNKEWAEICFVPNVLAKKKDGLEYRYLATREAVIEQMSLPGIPVQTELPFQTVDIGKKRYKVFGTVTNMDWEGEKLIRWQHERCGKSEEAHAVMKEDLAGGRFPSNDFGENGAWWWIMILALNLNAIMKGLVLGGSWISKRMKAIRFGLINLPGRVMERSRRLMIRLGEACSGFETLLMARQKIAMLVLGPSG